MEINILEIGALLTTIVLFGILFFLKKKHVGFGIRTLVATAFGVAVGLIFKENFRLVAAFGTVYVNALQAFVIPLLLFSVISSITNLGNQVRLHKVGLKSVLFLLLNTLTASVLTLIAALSLGLGKGFEYAVEATEAKEVPTAVEAIVALFPKNIVNEWGSNTVVPILIFGLVVALAYNKVARKDETVKPFKAFVDAANKVLGRAVSFVVSFTPYAVTALIARAVGRSKVEDLLPLLSVLIVAYVLSAIQIFGVESLLIGLVGRLNPLTFLKKIAPAGIVAFTSQSSVGTLPVTVSKLKENIGVDGDVAAFTAGLGANLGMPGCAGIWPVLLAVFTIHQQGISYSAGQYALLIALTLLISIGTVGVPGTATITATALFTAAGLPVELIVLFSPISAIVDMARTATNVVGAATATVLTAKTEGLLDVEKYNAKVVEVAGEEVEVTGETAGREGAGVGAGSETAA
ncbi:dicarboxylate/amino acid:cation symporter [Butyrivibrio proteoclasticus]|uniref:dicarboxylate/amino acid:cation symporter n=1 Tax=Butyrivibrio proteoclasticus TaxID=43305 RepID=UPI0009DDE86A|nr:dicarboxylate/amino acid:cation symporter [Butyrivibrio proteoclasticus]